MTEYRVIIETTAASDLRGILRYITGILKEPVTAKRIYVSIKEKITKLDQMPLRFPLVNDDVLAERGIRLMPAENYLVFYVVDEKGSNVHVLRVLYNRRDWRNMI